MDEDNSVLPELKDIETKLGRKVPDSLVRSLTGGKHSDRHDKSATTHLANCKFCANSSDLKRLESKMSFLKQEMVSISWIIYSFWSFYLLIISLKMLQTILKYAMLSS